MPVTCASFTQYQLTAACDPTDFSCAAFDVVADISFDTYWGCPWCKLDCCGACEGELENYIATHELKLSGCGWQSLDSEGEAMASVQCCPETYDAGLATGGSPSVPPSPEVDTRDIGSTFVAYRVSYDAADAGSNVTTDLCAVYAGVQYVSVIVGWVFYVEYEYTTGASDCKRYEFPIKAGTVIGYSVEDHIDCINAQSGIGVNSLGLTATGIDYLLMASNGGGIPSYPRTRIDTGAVSIPILAYQPRKVYFTWSSYVDTDPPNCCAGDQWDCMSDYGFTIESNRMQRLTTTQAWIGTADCPYSYSYYTVTSMGDKLSAVSISLEEL